MYAICIECSHQRGMGNLFRSLNIINWFHEHKIEFVVLINEDVRSMSYLDSQNIAYHIVDLWDYQTNWEKRMIEQYKIKTWINDRMATDIRHVRNIKNCGVKLCSFDDTGSGAELTDKNFCSMVFDHVDRLKGKEVFTGVEYMILNPEIQQYRKHRTKKERILITLGGSDTYGVTVRVAKDVKNLPYDFTIVVGYCFNDYDKLQAIIKDSSIQVKNTVPSLIEFFSYFDLAITGGGITSFEACSAGIPCIIIANEHHEEQVGRFFKRSGCAEYLGYYQDVFWDQIGLCIEEMDVAAMSNRALQLLTLSGLENTMREITK